MATSHRPFFIGSLRKALVPLMHRAPTLAPSANASPSVNTGDPLLKRLPRGVHQPIRRHSRRAAARSFRPPVRLEWREIEPLPVDTRYTARPKHTLSGWRTGGSGA
jgi:hypothetical protein